MLAGGGVGFPDVGNQGIPPNVYPRPNEEQRVGRARTPEEAGPAAQGMTAPGGYTGSMPWPEQLR